MKGPAGGPRRWLLLALGPALFALVELLFRPTLALAPELAAVHPGASPVLVRHALACTAWIAAWWFTEAIPIPATSLLPLVLFPLLGLGSTQDVAREYGHEIVFLFLGGLLLALAMERTGLHERVALGIARVFGRGRRALVLGFMVATATISLWISNTAAAVMLLPVALAVLGSIEREERGGGRDHDAFGVALLLGIAFAANIGGLGTPLGSPPNIVFQSLWRAKTGEEIGFLAWMLYGVPIVLLMLPATWWLLVRRLPADAPAPRAALPALLPPTRDQRWVRTVFLVTAALWITRGDLGFVQGWGARLAEHGLLLHDSTVAVAAALVLFVVPGRDGSPILDWSVAPRLPWGVLLLMGAGFAISRAFDSSGLTLWIGSRLEGFGRLPLDETALFVVLLLAITAVSIAVTEFASNTASASILLPIVFGVCAALGPERFPPHLLMIACALACTSGFAVPAGTPPNALVFATGLIPIRRFVRIGLLIDLLALLLIVLTLGARHLL